MLHQPQLCDYSGQYYCGDCHWGDSSVIPARVLHNWDLGLKPVSRASKQYLKLMRKKPIINVEAINPQLFSFIDELAMAKVQNLYDIHVELLTMFFLFQQRLRNDVLLMKEYLMSCKEALESKLLRLLEDRQHFVENATHYTIQVGALLVCLMCLTYLFFLQGLS